VDAAIGRAGQQYIGGRWVDSSVDETVPLENPATEAVFAEICAGSTDDADRAVAAARQALGRWSTTPVQERIGLLSLAARLLRARSGELAQIVAREVGTPVDAAASFQVGRPIDALEAYCDAANDVQWTHQIDSTLVVREAAGVVVAITPWNAPLHQAIAKVGAALAAGCTVVLKPAELAPLTAYVLADVLADAGLPAGVLNVVSGRGARVGPHLVSHPDVDVVSFTGSTAVGRQIGALAAASVKRVALELGGKGPSVVLDGADVANAAALTAARCFVNSGQVCAALTRLLVPRASLGVAEDAVLAEVAKLELGDPLVPGPHLGPLISGAQKRRVTELISSGIQEGARILAGGPDTELPARGHYVAPTVFSDVAPEMEIAQVEIFGPVLSILPYDSAEEAVDIANRSEYGLTAAVWAGSTADGVAIARQLRAGMVGVNGGRINIRAPFGGYKHSGHGREFGTEGISEFLETKAVNFANPGEASW
jgi:aldehyde dehydrogenase (NAD+)